MTGARSSILRWKLGKRYGYLVLFRATGKTTSCVHTDAEQPQRILIRGVTRPRSGKPCRHETP